MKKHRFKRVVWSVIGLLCMILPLTTTVYGAEDSSQSKTELDKAAQITTIREMDSDTLETYLMGLIGIKEPTETDKQALLLAFETILNPEGYKMYNKEDVNELTNYRDEVDQSTYSSNIKNHIVNEIDETIETSRIEQSRDTRTLLLVLGGAILFWLFLRYVDV